MNDIIGSFLNNRYDRQNYIDSSAQCFYVTLPYFGKHSEKLKSDLSVLFCKYFKDISFNFILVNSFKIDSFFSFKDRLSKGMRSSLIYKYYYIVFINKYIMRAKIVILARIVVPCSARWFSCSLGCTLSWVGWGRLVAIVAFRSGLYLGRSLSESYKHSK